MKYLVLLFTVFLFSCNNSKGLKSSFQKDDIVGDYKVIYVAGIEDKDVATKGVTINFNDNGKVNGNNSCNNYGGSYEIDKNELSFGMLMQTKMFCQENAEIETVFMRNLSEVDGFKIQKDVLILLQGNTHKIEAEKVLKKE